MNISQIFSSKLNFSKAESKLENFLISQKLSSNSNFLLKMQLILPSNGLYLSGIESQVFLHIITAFFATSLPLGETE